MPERVAGAASAPSCLTVGYTPGPGIVNSLFFTMTARSVGLTAAHAPMPKRRRASNGDDRMRTSIRNNNSLAQWFYPAALKLLAAAATATAR